MRQGICVFVLLVMSLTAAVRADSIRVHCVGEGPVVALIGGGPAFTTWNLTPIQDTLEPDYRVCRWDMRGVGENAGLPVMADSPVLTQWLDDMATVLPPGPVILWGHSWGALQVLLFARQFPDRVARLILSNPVDPGLASLEGIEAKRFSHPEIDTRLRLEQMGTADESLHRFRSKIASYFVDGAQGWAYASGFTEADGNKQLNVRIWDEYRADPLTEADLAGIADRIGGLIYCRQDVLHPENLAAYTRQLGPGRQQVIEGCAHFPWEENPDAYYPVLRELLAPP